MRSFFLCARSSSALVLPLQFLAWARRFRDGATARGCASTYRFATGARQPTTSGRRRCARLPLLPLPRSAAPPILHQHNRPAALPSGVYHHGSGPDIHHHNAVEAHTDRVWAGADGSHRRHLVRRPGSLVCTAHAAGGPQVGPVAQSESVSCVCVCACACGCARARARARVGAA